MLIDTPFVNLSFIDKLIKLLPLFSPIILFLFGYFLKFLDEKRNISREIKATQSFCISWLNISKKNICKLHESATGYSNYINEVDNKLKGFHRHNLMLDRINEVKILNTYNTFVTNKIGKVDYKNQLFFDFCNYLDVINSNYKSLENILKKLSETEDEISKMWIKLDTDFRDYRSKFNIVMISNDIPDYVMFIKDFLIKKSSENNNNISFFVNECILPFKTKYKDYLKKYPNDNDLTELIRLFDDFNTVYIRWRRTRDLFSKKIKNAVDKIFNDFNELDIVIVKLKEMKFNCIIFLR